MTEWTLNRDECIGCGICTRYCKDITMEDGAAMIQDKASACIAEAADVCPRQIIQPAA